MNRWYCFGFLLTCYLASCIQKTPAFEESQWLEALSINQMQIIASHNSYRLRTYEPLFNKISGSTLPGGFDARELDYTHEPIETQLSLYGVRGLELDIYHDPTGGRFYYRGANILIQEPRISHIPELLEPGFKVLHIPDLDYMTHHYTFRDALQTLKKWSDAHPRHLPLFVNVEPKEDALRDYIESDSLVFALPFTPNAADSLDAEVKAVFGENLEKIITPDEIRGDYPTLLAATKAGNLPTVAEARGKIFFILDTRNTFYKEGHPSLQGRVMFQYDSPHKPESCFVIANDPVAEQDSIPIWVKMGYMVRTRADAGTYEARDGDYSMRNAAIKSGAQIISTDYYRADPRHSSSAEWTNYEVHFPNRELARLNRVLADTVKFRGLEFKE